MRTLNMLRLTDRAVIPIEPEKEHAPDQGDRESKPGTIAESQSRFDR